MYISNVIAVIFLLHLKFIQGKIGAEHSHFNLSWNNLDNVLNRLESDSFYRQENYLQEKIDAFACLRHSWEKVATGVKNASTSPSLVDFTGRLIWGVFDFSRQTALYKGWLSILACHHTITVMKITVFARWLGMVYIALHSKLCVRCTVWNFQTNNLHEVIDSY